MTITITENEYPIQSINIVFDTNINVTKVVEGLNKQVAVLEAVVNQ